MTHCPVESGCSCGVPLNGGLDINKKDEDVRVLRAAKEQNHSPCHGGQGSGPRGGDRPDPCHTLPISPGLRRRGHSKNHGRSRYAKNLSIRAGRAGHIASLAGNGRLGREHARQVGPVPRSFHDRNRRQRDVLSGIRAGGRFPVRGIGSDPGDPHLGVVALRHVARERTRKRGFPSEHPLGYSRGRTGRLQPPGRNALALFHGARNVYRSALCREYFRGLDGSAGHVPSAPGGYRLLAVQLRDPRGRGLLPGRVAGPADRILAGRAGLSPGSHLRGHVRLEDLDRPLERRRGFRFGRRALSRTLVGVAVPGRTPIRGGVHRSGLRAGRR